MNSLKGRLIVGVAIVFAVGFLLAAMAIYAFFRTTMYAEFDQALLAKAQALAASTQETENGVRFQITEGLEEFTRQEAPSYYQVWLDGKVLERSPRLDRGDLEFGYGSFRRPAYAPLTLPDGRSGRQVCVTFVPKLQLDQDGHDDWDDEDDAEIADSASRSEPSFAGSQNDNSNQVDSAVSAAMPADSGVLVLTWERQERRVTVAVASGTGEIEGRLASLLWILPTVGAAITVLSSCTLVFVVSHALKPAETVTQAIAAIDENSLSARVPTRQVPSEISPMVTRLNDLLRRLDHAFHRERAFSSNLAHELRTPLAGLKSTLEVYLSRDHEPKEYQEAMEACLTICDQSSNLVESLLALARVEADSFQIQLEAVDVGELFQACWQPLSESACQKGLQINFDIVDAQIKTDGEMLRVILRNLLSNAVAYSDAGGTIWVNIKKHPGKLTIDVRNTGNELKADEIGKVFDRLWRGDTARGQTGEHFGLGLTLTKRFATALGGSVRVEADELFRIRIELPA